MRRAELLSLGAPDEVVQRCWERDWRQISATVISAGPGSKRLGVQAAARSGPLSSDPVHRLGLVLRQATTSKSRAGRTNHGDGVAAGGVLRHAVLGHDIYLRTDAAQC